MRSWTRTFTQSPDGLLHSNGAECCAIGACCPPGSPQQSAALAKIVRRDSGLTEDQAARAAARVLESFDLVPKGTGGPLVQAIAEAVRHGAP